MGRGAQAQTQQMIDQQLAQQNAMNQQLYSSSQSLGSASADGYQNMVANPGYSDAQKSAITNLSQSALSSTFDALAQNASNRAANSARVVLRKYNGGSHDKIGGDHLAAAKIRPLARFTC
jgi:hypothetical protein